MALTAAEQELLDRVESRLSIGGEWVAGENGTFDVFDPATGEVIKNYC